MQTLYINKRDPDTGESRRVAVTVVRSWSDVSGANIFLHSNGIYGYKDGAPVRADAEFAIIGDPIQRRQAEKWWSLVGREMSAKYYNERSNEIESRNLRGLPALDAGALDLDSVLYRRRPIADRRRVAYGDPSLWPVFFASGRPDWWGHAGVIEIDGYRYERVEIDEEEDAEDPPDDEEQTPVGATKENHAVTGLASAITASGDDAFDTGPPVGD